MLAFVVDDSATTAVTYRRIVEKAGLVGRSFSSPIEALEALACETPDIVFVDYQMPELDGIAFIELMREICTETPVVLVTANHDADLRRRALRAGASRVFVKPVDLVALRTCVHDVLDKRSAA